MRALIRIRVRRMFPGVSSHIASLLAVAAMAGAAMASPLALPLASSSTVQSPEPHSIDSSPAVENVLSTDGMWLPIPPPPGRREHTAVYDSKRGRMIVFGGYQERLFLGNDVWELVLGAMPIWQRLEPAGTPPTGPAEQAAIYDPVRDRMLLYGTSNVWELTLSGTPTWSLLAPVGGPPPARSQQSAIYDPVGDRMVIFGGGGYGGGTYLDDVWSLSLSGTLTWTQVSPAGGPPAPRSEHVAVYDAARHEMIIYGGIGAGVLDDAWTLSLGETPTWTPLAPTGGPPAARQRHAVIYDPLGDRMIVFGGESNYIFSNEVWELSLGGAPAWNALAPAGPPPSARAEHTAIYDPVGERMVVFGGTDVEDDLWHISHLNDVWTLSLEGTPAWSEPAGSSPGGLGLHSAIYRSAGDQVVVFGGYDGWYLHNDVWTYSPVAVPNWSRLAPSGAPPSRRRGHSAIYDPIRDRMIVFGGQYGGGNDLWELTFSAPPTWNQLAPLGTPPSARTQHSAIYDPVRDRMLVFGGYGPGYNNDLWELTLSGAPTWTQLAPAGTLPVARTQHSAIYDPVFDRMLVFGGRSSSARLGDVQSLSLSGTPTWTTLATSGTPPSPTYEHTTVYDPLRGLMVVFGGVTSSGAQNRVWALSLGGTPTWSELLPSGARPRARSGSAAIYDPVRDRMVIQAGWRPTAIEYTFFFNDVWMLTWSDLVGVPAPAAPSELGLAASYPNPAVTGLTIRYSLPVEGRASLVIYDLAGRRVKTLLEGHEAAGPHEVHWDLSTDRGARAGAGVYFYELRAAGGRAVRRLVLVE